MEKLSRKQIIDGLGAIATEYKRVVPDDKKEGEAIYWGIQVTKQAIAMLKEGIIYPSKVKKLLAEIQCLTNKLNEAFISKGLPTVELQKGGRMWLLKINTNENLCLTGHWSEDHLEIMKAQLEGMLIAFSHHAENCCDKAEKQGDKCLGLSNKNDDEPLDVCKDCMKFIYREKYEDSLPDFHPGD